MSPFVLEQEAVSVLPEQHGPLTGTSNSLPHQGFQSGALWSSPLEPEFCSHCLKLYRSKDFLPLRAARPGAIQRLGSPGPGPAGRALGLHTWP